MERYPRNCWYMAGWAGEIGEQGLAREILGRGLYLCRLGDGRLNAILDRSRHRFAPLSRGTREDDVLVCGYDGLAIAPDGRCVRNPFADHIPAGSTVPTFAVEERDAIIWLWELGIDQVGTRARRLLETMIAREASAGG